jgi:hypothetical protein
LIERTKGRSLSVRKGRSCDIRIAKLTSAVSAMNKTPPEAYLRGGNTSETSFTKLRMANAVSFVGPEPPGFDRIMSGDKIVIVTAHVLCNGRDERGMDARRLTLQ